MRVLVYNILEPARVALGEPIVITSGYRCQRLNKAVGGVQNSQHCKGEAVDIRLPNADYANRLFDILAANPMTDQLLYEHVGKTVWIHVSTAIDRTPRNMVRRNYCPT